MNQTMHYKGREGSVLFDAEDNFFHGKILNTRHFYIYGGADLAELERNFQETVDEYLKDESERGASFQ